MDLFQNPFYILSASPRDNKSKLKALADEKSLIVDPVLCSQAFATLTNPRKRLSAEISWLPSITPKKAIEILEDISQGLYDIFNSEDMDNLARANIHITLFKVEDIDDSFHEVWIEEIARVYEEIDPLIIQKHINSERISSGFSECNDIKLIEAELQERRKYYVSAIKQKLDKLESKKIVYLITSVVESTTEKGNKHGYLLIDDLVDSYELEVQAFLDKETSNIQQLVTKIKDIADARGSDQTIENMINQLAQIVGNWDTVAQPIQVSAKSRGLTHKASHDVADLIRDLSLHLFNKHNKLKFSQRLTEIQKSVFAEVAKVAELASEDSKALDEISINRELLDPIKILCKESIANSEKLPSSADREAQRIIDNASILLEKLSSAKVSIDVQSQGKDIVANALINCAIAFGNKTEKWSKCLSILSEAQKYVSSRDVQNYLNKNFEIVKKNEKIYRNLSPISEPPSLRAINGIGFTLYGSTDFDIETNSHLSTYYFVFFAIPLFPICRYRVIPTLNGYRFLGKAPLRTFDIWHICISILVIFIIILLMANA